MVRQRFLCGAVRVKCVEEFQSGARMHLVVVELIDVVRFAGGLVLTYVQYEVEHDLEPFALIVNDLVVVGCGGIRGCIVAVGEDLVTRRLNYCV